MSFHGYDIYGNNLRKGHCSVHPDVSHDYPCPQCRNEDDDRQSQEDAYRLYCEEKDLEHWQEVWVEMTEAQRCVDGDGI